MWVGEEHFPYAFKAIRQAHGRWHPRRAAPQVSETTEVIVDETVATIVDLQATSAPEAKRGPRSEAAPESTAASDSHEQQAADSVAIDETALRASLVRQLRRALLFDRRHYFDGLDDGFDGSHEREQVFCDAVCGHALHKAAEAAGAKPDVVCAYDVPTWAPEVVPTLAMAGSDAFDKPVPLETVVHQLTDDDLAFYNTPADERCKSEPVADEAAPDACVATGAAPTASNDAAAYDHHAAGAPPTHEAPRRSRKPGGGQSESYNVVVDGRTYTLPPHEQQLLELNGKNRCRYCGNTGHGTSASKPECRDFFTSPHYDPSRPAEFAYLVQIGALPPHREARDAKAAAMALDETPMNDYEAVINGQTFHLPGRAVQRDRIQAQDLCRFCGLSGHGSESHFFGRCRVHEPSPFFDPTRAFQYAFLVSHGALPPHTVPRKADPNEASGGAPGHGAPVEMGEHGYMVEIDGEQIELPNQHEQLMAAKREDRCRYCGNAGHGHVSIRTKSCELNGTSPYYVEQRPLEFAYLVSIRKRPAQPPEPASELAKLRPAVPPEQMPQVLQRRTDGSYIVGINGQQITIPPEDAVVSMLRTKNRCRYCGGVGHGTMSFRSKFCIFAGESPYYVPQRGYEFAYLVHIGVLRQYFPNDAERAQLEKYKSRTYMPGGSNNSGGPGYTPGQYAGQQQRGAVPAAAVASGPPRAAGRGVAGLSPPPAGGIGHGDAPPPKPGAVIDPSNPHTVVVEQNRPDGSYVIAISGTQYELPRQHEQFEAIKSRNMCRYCGRSGHNPPRGQSCTLYGTSPFFDQRRPFEYAFLVLQGIRQPHQAQ